MSPTFSSKHPAFTIPTTKMWLLMMPYLSCYPIQIHAANLKAGLITFNESFKYPDTFCC